MALPKEVDAEKVRAVNDAIGKMTPQQIGDLPPLEDDDFKLFGIISQHHCFIDLNLRRALKIMHAAKRLPPERVKKYPNYRDADLADILRGSAQKMDPNVEDLEETLFRLEEIGRCRTYRNLVSHFAGKRYPNEDVYVFASKSDADARQVLGKELPTHGVPRRRFESRATSDTRERRRNGSASYSLNGSSWRLPESKLNDGR
jgi:hypothetical protein